MVRRGGVVHLLDFIFFPGCIIPTDNSKFDPNKLFPWMTWERFAKGRTLVGVDEDDEDFASAGLKLGEKKHMLSIDEMPSHTHSYLDFGYTSAWTLAVDNHTKFKLSDASRTTGATGGGKPHNNIQPSITVCYWRRVS